MHKIIIIGAGAAGMIAAIAAASCGSQVTLIEKNEKAGKKLFITGKGRCNVTNDCDVETLLGHVMTNKKFLYSAFYGFTSQDMMKLLEDAGLKLKVERGNRVFPQSDKSSDVLKTLTGLMQQYGVSVMYHTAVRKLVLDKNLLERTESELPAAEKNAACEKHPFPDCAVTGVVLENGRKLLCDSVIVTTGGLSYPATGSTGDGYGFAREAGHEIKKLSPSLVPLNIREDWVKEMQGLSLKNVRLSVFKGKKKVYDDFGEMLFTHFGISGPLVLSASALCAGYLNGDGALEAEIDLKPALDEAALDMRLLKDFEKYSQKQFHNALSDLLPAKMIPVIVRLSGIDPYKKAGAVTKEERQLLGHLLKHLRMHISGIRGYNEAIITKGGVAVKDINPSTMASKLCRGLYFAGEVLDLDALTGGFNLQIAWSTGWLAGKSAGKA